MVHLVFICLAMMGRMTPEEKARVEEGRQRASKLEADDPKRAEAEAAQKVKQMTTMLVNLRRSKRQQ